MRRLAAHHATRRLLVRRTANVTLLARCKLQLSSFAAWCMALGACGLHLAACSPHQRGRAPASLGRPRCRASGGARGQEASLTSDGHRKDQRVQDKLSSSPRASLDFTSSAGESSVLFRVSLRASLSASSYVAPL